MDVPVTPEKALEEKMGLLKRNLDKMTPEQKTKHKKALDKIISEIQELSRTVENQWLTRPFSWGPFKENISEEIESSQKEYEKKLHDMLKSSNADGYFSVLDEAQRDTMVLCIRSGGSFKTWELCSEYRFEVARI